MHTKTNHTLLQFIVPLIAVLLLVTTPFKAQGQQTTAPTKRLRVVEYGGDLLSLLGALAEDDLPIGFEADRNEPRSYIVISVKEATLEDILDAIVKAKPIYTWRRTSRGIEVLPKDRPDKFLDTVVSSFHVENASTYDALKNLIELQEVVNAMQQSGIRSSSSTNAPHNEARLNINLRGATVREVLNRITSESKLKFWTYQRESPGSESVTISIYNK